MHALLRRFAPDGAVEKSSYDDYYLDASSACASDDALRRHLAAAAGGGGGGTGAAAAGEQEGAGGVAPAEGAGAAEPDAPPPGVRVAGEGGGWGWGEVEAPLQRGAALALAAAAAARREVGLTVSCGVAGSKLLARLVGPLNKPSCTTCGPPQLAAARLPPLPRAAAARGVCLLQRRMGLSSCHATGCRARPAAAPARPQACPTAALCPSCKACPSPRSPAWAGRQARR